MAERPAVDARPADTRPAGVPPAGVPPADVPAAVPPATTTDEIVAASEAFAADFDAATAGYDLSSGRPRRRVAIVACMDARLDLGAAFDFGPGEVHVIRNAGGLVTHDVLRSLTLSQRELGTREVMVVQHTRCGLLGMVDEAMLDAIEASSGVRPPFALGGFADLDASVRASLDRVRAAGYLPHRDRVRGFIYDLSTARLREVASYDVGLDLNWRSRPAPAPASGGPAPRSGRGGPSRRLPLPGAGRSPGWPRPRPQRPID
jgi:carbonic anhydrase